MPGTSKTKYNKMKSIIIDLIDPISVPIWDSYIYALIVIEVSCQYFVEHFLKSKKETKNIVRDVITILEYQSRLKIKRL